MSFKDFLRWLAIASFLVVSGLFIWSYLKERSTTPELEKKSREIDSISVIARNNEIKIDSLINQLKNQTENNYKTIKVYEKLTPVNINIDDSIKWRVITTYSPNKAVK